MNDALGLAHHFARPTPHRFAWLAFVLSCVGATDLAAARPWVTNGSVSAAVQSGGTIYLGGTFTLMGPATGGGAALDIGTGALLPDWPTVSGELNAIAPDGAGGWFIGGAFTAIGGTARANLAHLAPDFSVTAWNPGTNGVVRVLVLGGGTLYAGGDFTVLGGQPRPYVGALDVATATPTAFNAGAANGIVRALAVSGGTVYVGGDYTSMGGQPRRGLAALDATTGQATAWNPNMQDYPGPGLTSAPHVWALQLSDSTLYVGGTFGGVGGAVRTCLAAVRIPSGSVLPWAPQPQKGASPFTAVKALLLRDSTLFVGGGFSAIGGSARRNLAAIHAGTGLALPFIGNVDGSYFPEVFSLAAMGTTLFAGGDYELVNGAAREDLVAVDAGNGALLPWNPRTVSESYSPIKALVVSGSTLLVGGPFRGLGTEAVSRANLAALDPATGEPTSWNPGADQGITCMAASGSLIYVNGAFYTVGGQPHRRLAAIDAVSGSATSWSPVLPDYDVFALAVVESTVYVGGNFTTIGGVKRRGLGAVHAGTGALTGWNPDVHGQVRALLHVDSDLFAGGSFDSVSGQRHDNLAAIDLSTDLATSWNAGTNTGGTVFALACDGSSLFAGGDFTSAGGEPRSRIAAFDVATGGLTGWDPGANGGVRALTSGGPRLYAGGMFTEIGGQPRGRAAAFETASGDLSPWDPGFDGEVDGMIPGGARVTTFGAFKNLGALYSPGLALVADGVTAVPPGVESGAFIAHAWPNPFRDRVSIAFALPAPGEVRLEVLDVAGRRIWSAAPSKLPAGLYRLAWSGRDAAGRACPSGLYFLRVRAPGFEVTRRVIRAR